MLHRGVAPIVTTLRDNVDDTGAAVGDELRRRGLVTPGDEVVFVSVHKDLGRPGANFLKLV